MKPASVHIGLVFLLLSLSVAAQRPAFYLGFDHILDNREYFTAYSIHQTFFGARINPGVCFAFDSVHSVRAGFNYMYEFGGEFLGVKPQPDLYYRFEGRALKLSLGSFPRREVMDYPLMLLTDSLQYYRPNVEGASVRYNWGWGTIHSWVDWMGRETEETREAIHAGVDAALTPGTFRLEAISTRSHLARTTAPADNNRIRDDGSLLVLAGTDLSGRFFLDELSAATGYAGTYFRQRPAPGFSWFHGWYSRLEAGFRFIRFNGSWYLGDPVSLMYGDPLYASGNYGRFDLFIDPFRNPRISSRIGWSFHVLPGEGLFHSQQVLLHVSL
jgi:hypothetical protein